MLIGRDFQLKIATIAVDSRRVAVMLPVDAIVKVVSQTSDGRLVHVVSNNQPYAMFALDLDERGRELLEPKLHIPQVPMDHVQIRTILNFEVEAARQHQMAAADRFNEIMREL